MELKDYIQPLRRWWWLIILSTLVAAASSFLATRPQPPIYATTTTLMVGNAISNPNPNSYDLYLTQQLVTTYVEIAQRSTVRNATMAALGLSSLPAYSVKAVPETQLMDITVTDTNPQRCQAVAAELARQLTEISAAGSTQGDQQRQAFIQQQLSDLEASIKATQDEITTKQADLAAMFSARQIADTQTQIAGLQNKLYTLQSNYASLLTNTQKGALNTVSVVDAPALPTSPIGPNKMATILLAAAIGLALAVAAAYLLEYLDDTLRGPEAAEKLLGLTTLGVVPIIDELASNAKKGEKKDEIVVLGAPKSGATEAYRMLRTNLQFASVDKPVHSLLVTSPSPSEGKSMTAANLAVTLAQAGQRVILMDMDLRRPRVHRVLGIKNTVGVTTALVERNPNWNLLLQETAQPGLRALCSGPLPPNPSELISSTRLRELLAQLQEYADIILLDSPPVTILSDSVILSTQVDGVLLVLDATGSRRDPSRRAVEALRQVNARVLGMVMNRAPRRGHGYDYYNHYYHYYYESYDSEERTAGAANKRRPKNGSADGAPTPPAA